MVLRRFSDRERPQGRVGRHRRCERGNGVGAHREAADCDHLQKKRCATAAPTIAADRAKRRLTASMYHDETSPRS